MFNRPQYEVADIFGSHAPAYVESHAVSWQQRAAIRAIMQCRTAALGGHMERCDNCGHERNAYNSCRNRHCPKCQSLPRFLWLTRRKAELLCVQYFHVVFTVPATIADVALQNQRIVYDILFRTVGSTLCKLAAEPKHLGARIGHISVLHTWSQNLLFHPHIHCVVPGGGLSLDGTRWVSARAGFFLSVRVLSRLFRGTFLTALGRAFKAGQLKFFGRLAHLSHPKTFFEWLGAHYKTDWVVYCKAPFAGPEQVLDYLGRYTHRVAISNQRLERATNDAVQFRWKDYHHGNVYKSMTLRPHEFIRRFLLHVLERRFVRIRHGGILGNRHRQQNLLKCRELIAASQLDTLSLQPTPQISWSTPSWKDLYLHLVGHPVDQCPACRQGTMVVVKPISPELLPWPPRRQRIRPPPQAVLSP